MHTYSEAELQPRLQELSPKRRVAFALMCVIRLAPHYRRYNDELRAGSSAQFDDLVEQLWHHVVSAELSAPVLDSAIRSCMKLVPSDDTVCWTALQPAAEDAVVALAYAYRAAATGAAQEAVWASRRAYEAMEQLAGQEALGIGYDEGARLAHPKVQAELSRQNRDLNVLSRADELANPRTLAWLRKVAEQEAILEFPVT
ncbi:MAG: hypothetical protein ACI81R_001339 [Bradymonadia bacterium]|jgi:uncharacterized protein YjaG (DUF416 family)